MPRSPRIYLEQALYYVTSRGDYSQEIFKEKEDYKMFLDLLKKYKAQYNFRLFAFCLLPNHFHLLLEMPRQKEEVSKKGVLSEIMHDLNSSYTKYFNGKYQQKGHLFRERYRAALIEKEPYLLKVSAYIHLNPRALNISDPAEYPYSSYIFYLNQTLPVDTLIEGEKEEVLRLLKGEDYSEFVKKFLNQPEFSGLHTHLRKGILGSADFENRLKAVMDSRKKYSPDKKISPRLRLEASPRMAPGIIALLVLFAASGLVLVLKIALEEKGKSLPAASAYKLPLQVKELLRDLENVEWQISIVSPSGGRVQSDTIYFQEGKFFSRDMSLRNFPACEYSLLIENEDKITWESRQPGPEGEALWKGEIRKGEMEGALRLRYADSTVKEFSFVSTGFKKKQ